ncbi:hypothetical protein [Streptomyces sp. NPDC050264]|uniref:hypothetical protein n=1 Tax=Streptomyces sp. NPDC050264 TaxID=3155038 RepID=UPI0034230F4B
MTPSPRPARGRAADDGSLFRPLDADADLAAACCAAWFVSRSAEHETTCVTQPCRSSAA